MAWRALIGGWWGLVLVLGLAALGPAPARAQAPSQDAVLELTQARVTQVVQDHLTSDDNVTLPYHWDRVNRAHPGEATIDIPFELATLPNEPYGVLFQRIGSTAEVWLNGTLLTRLGDTAQPNTSDYAKSPQYVAVPARLLERHNLFRIHLRADGGRRGGLSALTLGPESEVRPRYENDYFWRVSASLAITIFSLLVGSIAFALWATHADAGPPYSSRRDIVYLAAAVGEWCWALRVGDVALEQPPLPWPAWGVVVTAAFAGWICGVGLFCHYVAGWHRHRSMPWVQLALWLLFGSAIVSSTLSFVLQEPRYLTAWLACANLVFVGYAAVYLWAALRKPELGRLLVALAGTLNVVMGVRDWITIRVSGGLADNTWIRYSSVLFGLVLGYIVISRFRNTSARANDLMANLADRVADKELALRESYARLEVLAREQERTQERARILRDMHDGVGAHISSAIRQLQSGRSSREQVLQTLRDSLDQLKLSIDAMNLPPGDITALLANLRYRLAPRFADSDIELQWDVDLLPPVAGLDAQAMRQLQFMLFEALSNVLQHAHASVLRVEAAATAQGGVQLRIIDNGRGFNTQVPQSRGLLSLRERAAAIGAWLVLESQPGRTVVAILFANRGEAAG